MMEIKKCDFIGHNYLPAEKKAMHYSGQMQEVDYLKCSRCDAEYRFAYDEYWHTKRETDMWLKAVNQRSG